MLVKPHYCLPSETMRFSLRPAGREIIKRKCRHFRSVEQTAPHSVALNIPLRLLRAWKTAAKNFFYALPRTSPASNPSPHLKSSSLPHSILVVKSRNLNSATRNESGNRGWWKNVYGSMDCNRWRRFGGDRLRGMMLGICRRGDGLRRPGFL